MRLFIALLWTASVMAGARADTVSAWTSYFGAKGVTLKPTKTARQNTRNTWNYVANVTERQLVRQLARISARSAREEAYIHLSGTIAIETGTRESFRVFSSDCLVRATVQSSITIDDLIASPAGPPSNIDWYHVHPARRIIDRQFRRSHCRPPTTWPILPSSADISWFLERARKYFAARPDGQYRDRIVVHPLGVVELVVTEKGKRSLGEFKWTENATTQVYGNESMPGYPVMPQRVIQMLGARIDRIKRHGPALEAEIRKSVKRLSNANVQMRFIPMRAFERDGG